MWPTSWPKLKYPVAQDFLVTEMVLPDLKELVVALPHFPVNSQVIRAAASAVFRRAVSDPESMNF